MAQSTRLPRSAVRMLVAYGVLLFAAGSLGVVLREDLFRFFNLEPRLLLLTSGMLAITGVMIFLFLYLRGELLVPALERLTSPAEDDRSSRDVEGQIRQLEERLSATAAENRAVIDALHARLASSAPAQQNGIDVDAVLTAMRAHVTATLATEIESRLEQRLLKDVVWRDTRQVFDSASTRLREEITSLTRRANVNLLIGVATTIMAVSLLVYMVLTATSAFTAWPELLSHYVPRIATVVFIEVFSFFFFRLYRASLAEVKYYHRELTALDSNRIALSAAHGVGEPKALTAVIGELSRAYKTAQPSTTGSNSDSAQLKEMADLVERLAKIACTAVSKGKSPKDGDG